MIPKVKRYRISFYDTAGQCFERVYINAPTKLLARLNALSEPTTRRIMVDALCNDKLARVTYGIVK